MNGTDDIINVYQEMVKDQVYDFANSKDKRFIVYRLYYFDDRAIPITSVEKNGYRYEFQKKTLDRNIVDELARRGLLIKIGHIDGVDIYTTLHADVVFRILRGRAFEDYLDGRWVGYYDIEIKDEYMPDFSAVDIDRLRDKLNQFFKNNGVDDKLAKMLSEVVVDGLRESGFKSIAKWQYEAISCMLSELTTSGTNKHYVITAPTAAGKTLVFQVVAIAYILLQKALSKSSNSFGEYSCVLILYPRKALQRQQLERLLKPLHFINKKLKEKNIASAITIAIDKGVELTDTSMPPGAELDTGIRCPHLEEHTIRVKYIKYEGRDRARSSQEVICSEGTKLDYIIGIVYKEQDRNLLAAKNPDILISNPWTLKSRLLSPQSSFRDLYRLRGLVILDEAHVYTGVDYLDLVASIRLHYNIRHVDNLGPTIVIAASATIRLDDPRKLLSWIIGVEENHIKYIDYFKLEPPHREKQRLKIIVTLLPYRLSLETTLQGVIQVILTATSNINLKSIVFVDSISEASTIMGYLDTIIVKRGSVEICDHISSKPCRENQEEILSTRPSFSIDTNHFDDYSWGHYVNVKPGEMKIKDLLNYLKDLINFIGLHHGALNDEERKELESGFTKGSKKLLISTSTLDLGMDYDDVTFIVQYKEPISGEVLEQRIGRAGRRDEALRISLTFYLPTLTPSLLQRIFSKKARDEEYITLPDESNIVWHYLAQILEYEILQAFRNLVNNSGHKKLDIRYALRNTLYRYLSEPEKLLNKWLKSSEKEKLHLGNFTPLPYTKVTRKDVKKVREAWQKLSNLGLTLRRHSRKNNYKKTIEDMLRAHGIPEGILGQDDIRGVIHRLEKDVKEYIRKIMKSVELCENIQDLEYNLDLIENRVSQCMDKLRNGLKELRNEAKGYASIKEILEIKLRTTKENKVQVKEWLRSALLAKELENLANEVEQSLEKLNNVNAYAVYAMMTVLRFGRISREYREKCKERCGKYRIGNNIAWCWYNCIRRSIISVLYGLKVTPSILREYEVVGLDFAQ